MSKLRIIVQFSGGKDSQACLIWAACKYGADKIEAVFCDTGWEHPDTPKHIHEVCEQMNVKLTVLRNEKIGGFQGLCKSMRNFPTPNHRACTSQLKIMPMIDFVLRSDDNFIIIQGIRAGESAARAKMAVECSYFKEYFDGNEKYRKRAVQEWCKTHDASVLRPVFTWTAQQVIDYILAAGQQPNPLYKRGASRVGCFPCIMARHSELRLVARDDAMRQRLAGLEKDVAECRTRKNAATFFAKGFIPERYCRTWGNGLPTAEEVMNYVTRDDCVPDMFEPEDGYSCMSMFHGLCE